MASFIVNKQWQIIAQHEITVVDRPIVDLPGLPDLPFALPNVLASALDHPVLDYQVKVGNQVANRAPKVDAEGREHFYADVPVRARPYVVSLLARTSKGVQPGVLVDSEATGFQVIA